MSALSMGSLQATVGRSGAAWRCPPWRNAWWYRSIDAGGQLRRRPEARQRVACRWPPRVDTKTQSPLGEPPGAPQPLQELGDARIHSWCGACRRTRYDATLCKEPNETTHPAHVVRRYKLAAPATGALASVVSELVEDAVVHITCHDADPAKPIRKMASGVGIAGYRKARMAKAAEMFGELLDK